MSEEANKPSNQPHWSFWLIGVVALVWNVMGAMNFVMQITNAEMIASMSEAHRAIIEDRPVWATGAFALAVFGGSLACLLLLLKKSIANYLFIASLLGVVVTHIPNLGLIGSVIVEPADIVMMILSPLIVAALLIWYTMFVQKKGWIS